tara:strand:+ start:132 stop:803 length:672 start_codon:yes stop_codon:yes gene_type:complete
MKLSNKELQPYRIWYQYLQTALKDKKFSNKVDKNYYKDWHLNLVKKLTFNQWIKTHEHLFTQSDKSEIKLFEGKRTPNTLLVEIPVSFNVQRIQREVGKAVKGRVAKTQSNIRFKIQTNRPLQTAPLDYFRWAYEYKQSGKLKLEEIWTKVNQKQIDRQKKVAKRVERYLKTGKGIRKRALSTGGFAKVDKNKAVLISRNIKKAQNILINVCKGVFPGNYSDH